MESKQAASKNATGLLIITAIVLTADFLLSVLFMKNELDSDGYLEIGVPFTFFAKTDAKMFGEFDGGFIWKGFF